MDNGRLRYLHGKEALEQPRMPRTRSISFGEEWMAIATVFAMFTLTPEACPKMFRIEAHTVRSWLVGLINNVTSSVNIDRCCLRTVRARGVRIPDASAFWNRCYKGSMHSINNIGEIGSPCRRPHQLYIVDPGTPLTAILVVDVDSNPHIQALHLGPNPIRSSTSSRNDH